MFTQGSPNTRQKKLCHRRLRLWRGEGASPIAYLSGEISYNTHPHITHRHRLGELKFLFRTSIDNLYLQLITSCLRFDVDGWMSAYLSSTFWGWLYPDNRPVPGSSLQNETSYVSTLSTYLPTYLENMWQFEQREARVASPNDERNWKRSYCKLLCNHRNNGQLMKVLRKVSLRNGFVCSGSRFLSK